MLHRSLPNDMESSVYLKETRFQFPNKGKAKFDHKHDLVYYVKCPECHEDYIGEISREFHEQICNIVGRIAPINTFLLKISIYFEMVILIVTLSEKYRKRCLLKNYVLR